MFPSDHYQASIRDSADREQHAKFVGAALLAAGCWSLRTTGSMATRQFKEEWRSLNSLSIVEVKRLITEWLELQYDATDIAFFQTPAQQKSTMEDALYFSVKYLIPERVRQRETDDEN